MNASSLEEWAVQPLGGESLSFATGGLRVLDSGWPEAGARSAHRALRGKVFRDLLPSLILGEACSATPGGKLLARNQESGRDACLLLRGEYHLRDLAGEGFCEGGPSTYPASDSSLWSRLPLKPVYDDDDDDE